MSRKINQYQDELQLKILQLLDTKERRSYIKISNNPERKYYLRRLIKNNK